MDTLPDLGRVRRAGWLLGIALGGFFDGILLHQVLQWHHLLSAVDSPRVQSLAVQVTADGVFHLAMYALAGVGLWQLSSARTALAHRDAGGWLWGTALAGFGLWHVADIVLNHWLLVLHRTRMDAPDPLRWDLIWIVVFGLLPLALGLWLRRPSKPLATPPGSAALGAWATLVLSAGVASAWPSGSAAALVMLDAGQPPSAIFAWADARQARVVQTAARDGGAWLVRYEQPRTGWAALLPLQRHDGAWVWHGGGWVAGCLGATRLP